MLRLSVLRPSEVRRLAGDIARGERHDEFAEGLRDFLKAGRDDDEATRDLITAVAAELTSAGVWEHFDPAAMFARGATMSVGRMHAFARGLPETQSFRFRVGPDGEMRLERLPDRPGPDPFSGPDIPHDATVTVESVAPEPSGAQGQKKRARLRAIRLKRSGLAVRAAGGAGLMAR